MISHLKKTRFPIDLGSLARVEEMIVDNYGAPNFDSLGNGSFLGFVASHDKACEALGGRLIGTNSSSSHIAGVKKKVMSIIQQLNLEKRDDQVHVYKVCNCIYNDELYVHVCAHVHMCVYVHVY